MIYYKEKQWDCRDGSDLGLVPMTTHSCLYLQFPGISALHRHQACKRCTDTRVQTRHPDIK